MMNRLAPLLVSHRRLVIGFWLAFLGLAIVVGPAVLDRLQTEARGAAGVESSLVADRLESLGRAAPDVVALIDGVDLSRAADTESITRLVSETAAMPGVLAVDDPVIGANQLLISIDGDAILMLVAFEPGLVNGDAEELSVRIDQLTRDVFAGHETLVGGEQLLETESIEQNEADLQRAELLSLPIVLVLAFVIFGGLLAASLPLVVALVAIPGALLVLYGVSEITDLHVFALNAATMLGLGLAIDYALLIVNRFREERGATTDVGEAVVRTVRTAGATVAFSGLTVTVALLGFLVFDNDVFRSIGLGGMGVVSLSMLAAVTLLPAILASVGHRIPGAVRDERSGRAFARIAAFVQRRPLRVSIGVGAALVVLALPFAGVRLEIPGAESLPDSLETRQLLDERNARFSAGGEDPITVVVDSAPATMTGLADTLTAIEGVRGVEVHAVADPALTVIEVVPDGPAQGRTAESVVTSIRALELDPDVAVGGPAAELMDQRAALYDRLPAALGVVALATLVLLFMLTGSVVIPIKAMVMNLLSLTATFGVLVWGFQDGHLAGILGFDSVGFLPLWLPFLIFFLAFGLSMDYEVFLLARMREEYDRTGDNARAVSVGLQRTGRIITSAALLIAVVFAAFATGDTIDIKAFGIGLALAIVVDASIVRTLLVPAAMELMGDWNWWAPAPLRRFHDRWGLSEPTTDPADADDRDDADEHDGEPDHGVMTPQLARLAR